MADVVADPLIVEASDQVGGVGLPGEDVVPPEPLRAGVDVGPGGDGDPPDAGDLEDEVEFSGEVVAAAVAVQAEGPQQPPLVLEDELLVHVRGDLGHLLGLGGGPQVAGADAGGVGVGRGEFIRVAHAAGGVNN